MNNYVWRRGMIAGRNMCCCEITGYESNTQASQLYLGEIILAWYGELH